MEGQRIVGGTETVVEPVLEHSLRSADTLFRRLHHEHQRARPIVLHRHQAPRSADHRSDMHIVPAGMHHRIGLAILPDLRGGGGVVETGAFLHRKPVHIGAQHDQRAVAVAQHADHAGAANILRHRQSGGAQFGGHALGGICLEEGKLGVLVEVNEKVFEVGVVIRCNRVGDLRAIGQSRCRSESGERRGQSEIAHRSSPCVHSW